MINSYHTKKKNVKRKCYIVVCVRLKTAITTNKNLLRKKFYIVVGIRNKTASTPKKTGQEGSATQW